MRLKISLSEEEATRLHMGRGALFTWDPDTGRYYVSFETKRRSVPLPIEGAALDNDEGGHPPEGLPVAVVAWGPGCCCSLDFRKRRN
jgi:hypothetical protein